MARIFTDTLHPDGCSGLYTLMGYVGGQWQDVQTIAGTTNGIIEVDANLNLIHVDTNTYVPGQSYLFKWMDGYGVESNVRVIYIEQALQTEPGGFLLNETQGLITIEH